VKKILAGFMLAVILVCLVGATFVVDQTVHSPYYLLRAAADEDATTIDLAASKGNFASMPSGAVQIRPNTERGSTANGIEIIFAGGSAADKTFSYKIYAWRAINGPAALVCSGTGTLGTMDVVTYPSGAAVTDIFYADTLTCTDTWITTIGTVDNSGGNRCSRLVFDTCGYEWFYVEITEADGVDPGTGQAGDVSAFYSYY